MPRAQTDSTTASETKAKKKPAQRTVSRTKTTVNKTVSTTRRRTAARAPATKNSEETSGAVELIAVKSARKAPTSVAAQAARSHRLQIILGVAASISLVCIGTGVYVGVSEPGSIDVSTIIQAGNEQISRGEFIDPRTGQPVTRTISTQSDARRINSGLRATSPSDLPAPAATPEPLVDEKLATSTATTSDEQLPADETEEEDLELVEDIEL